MAMNTKSRSVAPTDLTAALVAAVDRAKQAEVDARAARIDAERALKLARGTGDVHAQAAAALADTAKRGPFYVGDDADTETSLDAVVRCVTGHGRTLWDIVEQTGIRRNRVSGLLVRIQQRRLPLKNIGDSQRAIWFLPVRKRPYSSRTPR